MTKKKTAPRCELANPVPMSEWSKTRESERISYENGAPDKVSWKTTDLYVPKELSYRGQKERPKPVFLAGRGL